MAMIDSIIVERALTSGPLTNLIRNRHEMKKKEVGTYDQMPWMKVQSFMNGTEGGMLWKKDKVKCVRNEFCFSLISLKNHSMYTTISYPRMCTMQYMTVTNKT